jgi:hypothetical protein
MRLTQTARILAVAVLLLVATAILWWGIGYRLGTELVNGAASWRIAYGYGPLGLVRLFALSLVVPLTLAVVSTAAPQFRWLALAAIALGAVMLHGDRSSGDVLAVVLFVFGAAAVAEVSGTPQLVVAVVAGVLVAFASLLDLPLAPAPKFLGILVRAVFFYTPLLLGPTYAERWVLRRVAK